MNLQEKRNLICVRQPENQRAKMWELIKDFPEEKLDRMIAGFQRQVPPEQFAKELQQQREQYQVEQRQIEFKLFAACCRATTAQGSNVSANDANFSLVKQGLWAKGEEFNSQNIIRFLMRPEVTFLNDEGDQTTQRVEFAPNSEAQTNEIDQEARKQLLQSIEHRLLDKSDPNTYKVQRAILEGALPYSVFRERVQLCEELANNHSPDRAQNDFMFRSLFISGKPNDEYRVQLAAMREKRKLAQMSPSEIRTHLAQSRQQVQQQTQDAELVRGFEREVLSGQKMKLPASMKWVDGTPFDADFVRKSGSKMTELNGRPVLLMRKLVHLFGNAQLTAVLLNKKTATADLDDGRGPQTVTFFE